MVLAPTGKTSPRSLKVGLGLDLNSLYILKRTLTANINISAKIRDEGFDSPVTGKGLPKMCSDKFSIWDIVRVHTATQNYKANNK